MIYLDNNATTVMPPEVQRALLSWCNRGNSSASYAAAIESRRMMDNLRADVALAAGLGSADTTTIFTSGASEANAQALSSLVDAATARGERAHIVMSSVEHKSLITHIATLVDAGRAAVTRVPVGADGRVRVADVCAGIRRDTVGVFVMHANNETGAVNDVAAIARECALRRIHFHCDMVQTFARRAPSWGSASPMSVSMSFHKIHGAPGVGALIWRGAKLPQPIIYGSQNAGLRGGTENLPGIGAAAAALTYTLTARSEKTARVARLAKIIRDGLAEVVPTRSYVDYVSSPTPPPAFEIVLFESPGQLAGTILLAVVNRRREMCNAKMKRVLEDAGIVVSIGSACNTSSSSASHVLYAMGCDGYIRRGTLRISLGDESTEACVRGFLRVMLSMLAHLR